MICDNCKKHIERKIFSNSETVNCLFYPCDRPYLNPALIECTRDEICDYIYMRKKEKCPKCPPEDHEGCFCRCESRNIQIAKDKREKGHSPWKK